MALGKPPEKSSQDVASVSTPIQPKKSESNPTSGSKSLNNATPASNPKRPAANDLRTTPKKTSTIKPKTPKSAPPRSKGGGPKRPETSLLEDFLLGRPSPHRARKCAPLRRASLEAVKADMKAEFVSKIQAPGKVQDRVKEWQKSSAIATPERKKRPTVISSGEKIRGCQETKIRLKNENKVGKKPVEETCNIKNDSTPGQKAFVPKKRVITDSHWMKEKERIASKGNSLPKNFLQTTALNPPLEKKIQDWVKRTECIDEKFVEKLKSCSSKTNITDPKGSETKHVNTKILKSAQQSGDRTTAQQVNHDNVRKPLSQRHSLKSQPATDNGVLNETPEKKRLTSSKTSDGGGIPKTSNKQEINRNVASRAIKQSIMKSDTQRSQKNHSTNCPKTQTLNSSKSAPRKSSDKSSHATSTPENVHNSIKDIRESEKITSSPSRHKEIRHEDYRTANNSSSLNETPYKNPAISDLDLPLGAEANSLKRTPPKRNPSFAVPKVLKRAFNEGMRKVHDSTEAPTNNLSQPARIESWLNTTTDPFIDRPTSPSATSDNTVSSDRSKSYESEDLSEHQLKPEFSDNRQSKPEKDLKTHENERNLPVSLVETHNNKKTHLQSPKDLRRSQAIRHYSSVKKTPFRESIINAFQGESALKKPKPSSIHPVGQNDRTSNGAPSHSMLHPSTQANKDPPKMNNQRMLRKSESEIDKKKSNIPISSPRKPLSFTGAKCLSTIASEESSCGYSNLSKTESMYSETTATQDTIHTTPYSSSLSCQTRPLIGRTSSKSKVAKHSDLISILSLPDTTEPGRSSSIRSARSLRRPRKNHSIGSIDDVLISLADEESQYLLELDTLVDGVIPVLLRCIYSSNAAELFDTLVTDAEDTSFIQPIFDMGVALENLRSQHKRIPLADVHALLLWAEKTRPIYEEYLNSWRSGFEDVVVNLAPASSYTHTILNDMKRDQNGDLLGDKGEKIFVADLLKKPIIRIKYISRAIKKFSQFPNLCKNGLEQLCDGYEALIDLSRRRIKEEKARKIDRLAWTADTTRARNLKTLNPADKFEINRSYQVTAKDSFSLEMLHSTGQRINCGVELVLRDLPEMTQKGDLLIFKKDDRECFLLFEPILKEELSARLGETNDQLVVMVRGAVSEEEYTELFVLDAEDEEVAADWVSMLGENPIPPAVTRTRLKIDPELASVLTTLEADTASVIGALKGIETNQIPIGERPREKYQDLSSATATAILSNHDLKKYRGPVDQLKRCLNFKELASISEDHILDIASANMILREKGILPFTYPKSKSQASNDQSYCHTLNMFEMSGGLDPYFECLEKDESLAQRQNFNVKDDRLKSKSGILDDNNSNSISSSSTTPCRNDGAPPPPVHRTPVSENLRNMAIPDLGTPLRKQRRTSSPLKHEYQPSITSGSFSEASTDSYSDTSSEGDSIYDCDEDEDEDGYDDNDIEDDRLSNSLSKQSSIRISSTIPMLTPLDDDKIAHPRSSFNGTLDEKCSAESLPQIFTAVLSQWNGLTGQWTSLYSDACTIVVTDGLIECFEIDGSGSCQDLASSPENTSESKFGRPIVKQTLTPVVQIRQSTAIDIEIKSAIFTVKESCVSKSILQISDTLRYRLFAPQACDALYAAIHRSRLRNKTYLRLEEVARIKSFEIHTGKATTNKWQRPLFGLGRKNSYRASTRVINDDRSVKSMLPNVATFRRNSGAGIFNISRSSVEKDKNCNGASFYTKSLYSGSSYFNNLTPPGTPNSQAGNSDSIYSSGLTVRNLGTSNISFRLYYMLRNGNWRDRGQAVLTVSLPPPDMKQKSPLYNGPQRRITITRNPIPVSEDVKGEEIQEAGVLLDEVLGANLFVRMQKSGILLQTWEDVSSNEENQGIRSYGSVAPRRHIWALQFRRAGDAEWCWKLCRSGLP
ncbi:hypothetical protein K3495_g9395 [Podosphaera aphanis]|nr:hypothetical protein K3495_g9395 [Podosphaera aphanis]